MKITLQFLKDNQCRDDMINFFDDNYKEENDINYIVNDLVSKEKNSWAIWLLTRFMNRIGLVRFLSFSVNSVLPLMQESTLESIKSLNNYVDELNKNSKTETEDSYKNRREMYMQMFKYKRLADNSVYAAEHFNHVAKESALLAIFNTKLNIELSGNNGTYVKEITQNMMNDVYRMLIGMSLCYNFLDKSKLKLIFKEVFSYGLKLVKENSAE